MREAAAGPGAASRVLEEARYEGRIEAGALGSAPGSGAGPFVPFVKAVGRGARLRRDLETEEAAVAIRLLLEGQATPAQQGGFLIGQRVKGEAEAEIRGFILGARQGFVRRISPRVADLLDLGIPYDGKLKTAQLGPAVALLLAACGLPVVLHGDEGIPTKQGITPGAVLAGLGVSPDLEPSQVEAMVEKAGIGHLSAARYAPAWHALAGLRRELGLRTALNTVEKLLNPADAPFQVSGFFHGEYIDQIRKAQTGTRKSWVVQGEEGSIEMAAGRPTHIFAVDAADDILLDPGSAGLPTRERLAPPFIVEAHVQLNDQAIEGTAGPASDQACFTAGVILALVGLAADGADGLARARRAARSGTARKQLDVARGFHGN